MKKYLLSLCFGFLFLGFSWGQAMLLSQFNFDNTFSDNTGNSECTAFNTLNPSFSGGIYSWETDPGSNGGGLRIAIPDAIFTENDFSMAIDFSYSVISGYRKILDFSEMQSDQGLYVNDQLRLYSGGNYGPTSFVADSMHRILITRDGANDTTRVYLYNGSTLQEESKVFDGTMDFVPLLIGAERVFYLFVDDSTTMSEFSPMAKVDMVRIWNGVADIDDYMNFFGIEELGNVSFSGYPNPATEIFTVHSDRPISGEVVLHGIDGRILERKNVHEATDFSFNLAHLPAGVYTVNHANAQLRFVKK